MPSGAPTFWNSLVIQHKASKKSQVADALSLHKHLLTPMPIFVPGFEEIQHEYPEDKDFGHIYTNLHNGEQAQHPHYSIHDGLFQLQGTKLRLPATFIYEHVIWESHASRCS